jgi:pimeloyl-ACP methyl ester carboxylesterase
MGLTVMTYAQTDSFPPFAVAVDTISFTNGNVRLTGAILKPEGNGPFPAVVFIHGAGQGTLGEPAFRIHANAFVRGGFAVLVYDKRGSGSSSGDLDLSDYDDLAADLAAGVKYLRTKRYILPGKIGLLGRSEGGWIGALAASRDPLIAFVILSSGSGVRPSEQVVFSTMTALREMGASQQEAERAMAAKSAQWEFYRKVAAMDSAAALTAEMQSERDSLVKELRSFARFVPQVPQNIRDPARTPSAFFRAFTSKIGYDPLPSFRTSRAPFLAVLGATDNVVDPVSTTAVFEQLRQAGHDVTVRILPDVGHSLVIMSNDGPRYPEDYPEFAVRWAREKIGRLKK